MLMQKSMRLTEEKISAIIKKNSLPAIKLNITSVSLFLILGKIVPNNPTGNN